MQHPQTARRVWMGVRAGDDEFLFDLPAEIAGEVQSTFRDQAADVGPGAFRVVVVEAAGAHVVTVDGRQWAAGEGQTVVDQLAYVTLRASLDAHPERLHLHCAAVAWRGAGLLLAGFPGSGKSTLTAQLVEQGFDYATDERVALTPGGDLVPFGRPLSLAMPSFGLFPHLHPRVSGAGSASDRLWHLPPSAIRPGAAVDTIDPVALVLLDFRPGAVAELLDVHPAEAVRLLLGDSADAVRLGDEAVRRAAQLCAGVRCTRLVFGDGSAAAARLSRLAGRGAPPLGTTEPLAASPGRAGGVVVADRCVLYGSGGVVELDEVSTVWFRLLDGSVPLSELAREVADANDRPYDEVMSLAEDMVRQLVGAGVLAARVV